MGPPHKVSDQQAKNIELWTDVAEFYQNLLFEAGTVVCDWKPGSFFNVPWVSKRDGLTAKQNLIVLGNLDRRK